jgi:hypothetical protein
MLKSSGAADLSQLSVGQLRATLRRKGLGVRSTVRKTEPLQRLGAILHKEDPEIRRRQGTERQAQEDSLIREAKECWQRGELSKLSNKQLQAALRCMGSRPGSGRKVELLSKLEAVLEQESPESRRRQGIKAPAQQAIWLEEIKERWRRRDLSQLPKRQLLAALRSYGSRLKDTIDKAEVLQRLKAIFENEDSKVLAIP